MKFISRLQILYGENTPILLEEIKGAMQEYSSSYIFQCIRKAIAEKELSRFDESVYYIPMDGILGKSKINTRKVIEKKYLVENGKTIGFYSGIGLLNAIGGTRQIPFVYEIVTNRESSRKRQILLGKNKFILRKSRCKVTDENKAVLQVLELCNKFVWNKEAAESIFNYAKNNNVTERDILKYSKYYPAKAIRNASEVLFGIA